MRAMHLGRTEERLAKTADAVPGGPIPRTATDALANEAAQAEVGTVLAQSNVDIAMGITGEKARTTPLGEPNYDDSTNQANEGMLGAANFIHLDVGQFPPGATNDEGVLELTEDDRIDEAA